MGLNFSFLKKKQFIVCSLSSMTLQSHLDHGSNQPLCLHTTYRLLDEISISNTLSNTFSDIPSDTPANKTIPNTRSNQNTKRNANNASNIYSNISSHSIREFQAIAASVPCLHNMKIEEENARNLAIVMKLDVIISNLHTMQFELTLYLTARWMSKYNIWHSLLDFIVRMHTLFINKDTQSFVAIIFIFICAQAKQNSFCFVEKSSEGVDLSSLFYFIILVKIRDRISFYSNTDLSANTAMKLWLHGANQKAENEAVSPIVMIL